MAGSGIPGMGSGDDTFDEEGYDESQRAEILEATRDGPSDGTILLDMNPDLGIDETEDEAIDELGMIDGETASADDDVEMAEEDMEEDDLQDDFDEDKVDDDLPDGVDVALRP